MKKLLFVLLCFLLFCFVQTHPVLAQQKQSIQPPTPAKQEYVKGQVLTITKQGTKHISGIQNPYQDVQVKVLEGSDAGKVISLEYGGMFTITNSQKVQPGDTVILSKTVDLSGHTLYTIADKYRLPQLIGVILSFFIFVIVIVGRRGVGSLLGMVVSLAIISFFIVPQILNGQDPLLISIVGTIAIMFLTTYLAHGFSKQTSIAVLATFLSLIITVILSTLFVKLLLLNGLGSEDIYSLQFGNKHIDFQGLLLGGIIISAIGVLNDVTTTQAVTISELVKTDPYISFWQLFRRGFTIGKEHILSLVNTLVLAYAGASIGIIIYIIITVQSNIQPLWTLINSEILAEEVVRTLTGSIGLILAVPITTLLASFFAKYSVKIK